MSVERRADRVALAVLAAATLWQLAPLLTPPFAGGAVVGSDSYRSHDWLEVAALDFYGRRALLEWGRFPLWNPLLAGGLPQAAHPSDGSLGPLFLLPLLFGHVLGMKVAVGLVALAGTLGLYGLLRRVTGVSAAAACAAALGFAWSGWLPSRVAVGFYESCLMAAWPLLLLLWLAPASGPGPLEVDPARRRRWAAAALILWALSIQLQLALPVLVLWMGMLWATNAVARRLAGAPAEHATAMGGLLILGLAALLGAVKFLPMLDLLAAGEFREAKIYPTHPDAWYRNFRDFWWALFHHVPGLPVLDREGNPRVQEYVTLLPGLGPLLLAAAGLPAMLRFRRNEGAAGARLLPWTLATLLFFWLSFGPHAPVDAFAPLQRLPLFSSMRGPLRYFNYPILIGIFVSTAAGADVLLAWISRSRLFETSPLARRAAPALVVAASAALSLPSALSARDLYRSSFLYSAEELPAPMDVRSEGLGGISRGGANRMNLRKYGNVLRGVPTIYAPEDLPVRVAAVPALRIAADGRPVHEPSYRGEAWVDGDGDAGSARVLDLRANEVIVRHTLRAPGLVLVNQNAWRGWRCGGQPASERAAAEFGLLGFEAAAGDGTTSCRYRERLLLPGLLLSLLGVAGVAALWPFCARGGAVGRRPRKGPPAERGSGMRGAASSKIGKA